MLPRIMDRRKATARLLLMAGLILALLLTVLAVAAIWPDRPPQTGYTAHLFEGVTYTRQVRSTPRPLMIHIVEIDLLAPGIDLLVTPGDKSSGLDLYARTTGAFLAEFGVQVAINGSFFEPFRPGWYVGFEPNSGDPVNVKGLSISNGMAYSTDYPHFPALCLSTGHAEIRRDGCPAATAHGLAGDLLIVEHGASVAPSRTAYQTSPHPRTAVAVDSQGTGLWLIVVDGRQPNYSEGVTLSELADIVLGLRAEAALNLDGGGSSTLVVEEGEKPRLLNAPIHTRIPMRQRPVGNHLGVRADPVENMPIQIKPASVSAPEVWP
jgi:hypothetical protein